MPSGPSGVRPESPALDRARLARRLWFVRGLFALSLAALIAALAGAQLRRSADYTEKERKQNLRRILQAAPRGVIYDRERRVLAGNRTRHEAVIALGDLRAEFAQEQQRHRSDPAVENERPASASEIRLAVVQRHLDRVAGLIGRADKVDPEQLARHYAQERLTPFVLLDDLTASEAEQLTAHLTSLEPVELHTSAERWYPEASLAAHVIGRVRRDRLRPEVEVDAPALTTPRYWGTLGEGGIEKQYEAQLAGRPGETVVRVDALGFPVRPVVSTRDAVPGAEIVLSLDLDLQRVAERMMNAAQGTSRGAAVALSIATGEVLALVSRPDYDLNAVSPRMSIATKQRIDAEGGWFNRATQGLYPPGSSFKVFTALAGLRAGTLRPMETRRCDGFLDVGGHRFVCHNAEGHGVIPLRTALAQSCNVFAYHTGVAAGAEALAAEARRFHFDRPTGIALPGETTRMLVPDAAWKQAAVREAWADVDTINLAIGQGFLRISPLQAACAMASLARRETLTVPTLLHSPGRRPTGGQAPEPLGLAAREYAALIDGMHAVVESGIGQRAQVPGLRIAGKTGTAQIQTEKGMANVAWFVAFAPLDQPEIAIAVALEGDDVEVEYAGAEHAAPIVRELIAAYFEKPRPP